MARMFEGTIDGWPCVKVTRDNADAPWSVPDSQYGKFAFNSNHQHAYVQKILLAGGYTFARPGSGQLNYNLDGSTWTNAAWRVTASNAARAIEYLPQFDGFDFPPIMEIRNRLPDGSYTGPRYEYVQTDSGRLAEYRASVSYTSSMSDGALYTAYGFPGYATIDWAGAGNFGLDTNLMILSSVWDLPADETPLPQNGTVVPGQMMARFTNQHAQVARPGFDVRTATYRQFVLNSDRVPAKIIQAGQTIVPANTTLTVAIQTPLELTDEAYIDFHVARGSGSGILMTHPPMPTIGSFNDGSYGFTYKINGAAKQLLLTNPNGIAMTVRWVLLADDARERSSGGSRIVYTGHDGDNGFVQVKIPGSSDANVRLNDILLDTRLPTLRIVKEGYLPWEDFTETPASLTYGERRKTVSFDNPDGFLPFVKFVQKIRVNAGSGFANQYSFPLHRIFRVNTAVVAANGWDGRTSGQSGLAVINSNNVQFHLSAGNPSSLVVGAGAPNPVAQPVYGGGVPLGIRYYIFALPELS